MSFQCIRIYEVDRNNQILQMLQLKKIVVGVKLLKDVLEEWAY